MSLAPQKGVALIMTLIILVVLTLLAMSSMDRVIMQELMVNAQREGDVTLELTEEVLREAERRIGAGMVVLEDFSATGPLYAPGRAPAPELAGSWQEHNSFAATQSHAAWSELYDQSVPMPRYFIEAIGEVAGMGQVTDVVVSGRQNMTATDVRPTGFRIVAMSRGPSGEARRIIEVYYASEL